MRLPQPAACRAPDLPSLRPVVRLASTKLWRTSPGRGSPPACTVFWDQVAVRRAASSTRSTRTDPPSPSAPAPSSWPPAWSPCCASCRRAARCAPTNSRATRAGAARSALAPGRAALRGTGLLPHSRRDRPPAVPVLPGDPVPPLPPAASGGDRLHCGAFAHPDRLGLRPGARRALVSAADRSC